MIYHTVSSEVLRQIQGFSNYSDALHRSTAKLFQLDSFLWQKKTVMSIPKTRFRRNPKTRDTARPTLDDAARLLAGIHESPSGETECPRCSSELSTVVGTRDGETIRLSRCATCAYSAVISLPADLHESGRSEFTFTESRGAEFASTEPLLTNDRRGGSR